MGLSAAEPALWLGLAGLALLLGEGESWWIFAAAALFAVALRRWEAIAMGLPGAASVAAESAASGPRWDLVLAGAFLVIGATLASRQRAPAVPMRSPRAVLAGAATAFVVGAGWIPGVETRFLTAYREGAALALATAALAFAASWLTAVSRARSGTMDRPATAGGAAPGV